MCTAVLTEGLDAIDREVEVAKTRAEQAEAEYKELREGAAMRKAVIRAKIEALNTDK